jgi:hypothetical protein
MRIAWKIVRWMRRKMGVRKRAELPTIPTQGRLIASS